jgi:hypothetical protein
VRTHIKVKKPTFKICGKLPRNKPRNYDKGIEFVVGSKQRNYSS